VLAAIVLVAIAGLINFREIVRLWRVSRLEFTGRGYSLGRRPIAWHFERCHRRRYRIDSAEGKTVRLVICDLSTSPAIDLTGARMFLELHDEKRSRNVLPILKVDL